MKPKSPVNPKLPGRYGRMTAKELDAETADLDRELIIDKAVALSPKLRRLVRTARKKRGRPRVGKGAQRISVTIERGLLREADTLARRRKVTRAQLIAQGLRTLLDASR
jgi:hypothetical protein